MAPAASLDQGARARAYYPKSGRLFRPLRAATLLASILVFHAAPLLYNGISLRFLPEAILDFELALSLEVEPFFLLARILFQLGALTAAGYQLYRLAKPETAKPRVALIWRTGLFGQVILMLFYLVLVAGLAALWREALVSFVLLFTPLLLSVPSKTVVDGNQGTVTVWSVIPHTYQYSEIVGLGRTRRGRWLYNRARRTKRFHVTGYSLTLVGERTRHVLGNFGPVTACIEELHATTGVPIAAPAQAATQPAA